ncbi:hypothetical protein SAMN02745131_03608 [Flavisolibacter ginsengisoli DSM 18119]|uniref:Uncharacterized protein n=1 Tax=Flavisolibacter ginsengisoli DSM 18119 TaxID=1121884 RepID=A0A1M5ERE2_9BACT|nr:hypothetical protein SAMN02745131_03608 [Flavisolibacter ginsengisoli DSM 18119]
MSLPPKELQTTNHKLQTLLVSPCTSVPLCRRGSSLPTSNLLSAPLYLSAFVAILPPQKSSQILLILVLKPHREHRSLTFNAGHFNNATVQFNDLFGNR